MPGTLRKAGFFQLAGKCHLFPETFWHFQSNGHPALTYQNLKLEPIPVSFGEGDKHLALHAGKLRLNPLTSFNGSCIR